VAELPELDAPEDPQRGEAAAGLVDLVPPQRLAGPQGELAPDGRGGDLPVPHDQYVVHQDLGALAHQERDVGDLAGLVEARLDVDLRRLVPLVEIAQLDRRGGGPRPWSMERLAGPDLDRGGQLGLGEGGHALERDGADHRGRPLGDVHEQAHRRHRGPVPAVRQSRLEELRPNLDLDAAVAALLVGGPHRGGPRLHAVHDQRRPRLHVEERGQLRRRHHRRGR